MRVVEKLKEMDMPGVLRDEEVLERLKKNLYAEGLVELGRGARAERSGGTALIRRGASND